MERASNKNLKSTYYKSYNLIKHLSIKSLIRRKITNKIRYLIHKLNYELLHRYFLINNIKFRYFINTYNAVNSERVVEIPIAIEFLKKHKSDEILEVGNVLSYYFNLKKRIIVDKYEKAKDILNIDILNYKPNKKFKAIISISTLEHIGFDEPVIENGKSLKAFIRIIKLLDKSGEALITVPLGYNPEIDDIIKNKRIKFSKKIYLKRVSIWNLWVQTDMKDALKQKYGQKYPSANAIAVLYLKK